MSLREEQCKKVCRILDDVLANRPTERDSLIVATRSAFKELEEPNWIPCSKRLPEKEGLYLVTEIYKYSDGRKEYEVNVDRWSRNGSGREWSMCSNDMIFAWMPLPEPFEGVTE